MGRRWGKSTLSGVVAANVLAHHGKVSWIVPTYKNSRAPWRWLRQTFADLAQRKIVDISTVEKVITTHLGGYLGIYSADNIDAVRGDWVHLNINDECGYLAEEAIYDALDATLADADGDQINIGTPKGRTWFWRDWLKGAHTMDGVSASWTAPTNANPMLTIQKAFALAQERLPERAFRQEWLAEFLDDAGGVFRGVRAIATLQPAEPITGHQYIAGLDWGKQNDYTVLSVFDLTTNRQVYLDRFNKIDWALQRERVLSVWQKYRPTTILAERNSIGDPNIEALQRDGVPIQPFVTTNATKAEVIERLSLAIERKEIGLLDHSIQTAELEAYEMERTPSGLVKYGAPHGVHDDCVMATALAWYGASSGGIGVYI